MHLLKPYKSAKQSTQTLRRYIMGFIVKSLSGNTKLVNQTRANNLDAARVMAAPKGAITPDSHGDWTPLSVPIPTKAQQYTHQQAAALVQEAAQVTAQVASTRAGNKALREMSRAFTDANVEHNTTKRVVAAGTLESIAANVDTAALLNKLRPAYAKAQSKLNYAFADAEGQISAMGMG
jgi:hypothetical protein